MITFYFERDYTQIEISIILDSLLNGIAQNQMQQRAGEYIDNRNRTL